MSQRIRVGAAAVVLAASALLALPATAAQASTIYPPSGSCTASPTTVAPGASVRFDCVAGTFSPSEDVTVTVTGENGAGATIGFVKFAVTTASGHVTSEADGSIDDVRITFPSNASGTYNIAAISGTSAGSTAAVTVTTDQGGLPTTGLDTGSLTAIWIGGAVLVLGGAAFATAAAVKRRKTR